MEVLDLDDVFARELPELHRPFTPIPVAEPRLLVFNDDLAGQLGLDAATLRSAAGIAVLAGNAVPDGSFPVAQGYAGHQFGGWSPRLGDGRAVLLGEVHDPTGARFDLHLKGSGRTPFSRGGDGRAAVGPMLREYLIAEAMHALGIPTTRALAVVATGESIVRESGYRAVEVPGAVLSRVASSHLRVGSFQYAAATGDIALLRRLTDHAIARHVPDAAEAEIPALALYEHVVAVQAALIARWMQVGFIHGVMNTDNMTISGETIDYGPCAFMDAYDPATVFSSIDHGGRYAYGNQPAIATWNLARLGESLLPLFGDDPSDDAGDRDRAVELATTTLQRFPDRFQDVWMAGMRVKLGLAAEAADDATDTALVADLLTSMDEHHIDWTTGLRSLSDVVRGNDEAGQSTMHPALAEWSSRWLPLTAPERADAMDRVNPIYVPRNHLVEEALAAATEGDLAPFDQLLDRVTHPFTRRSGESPELDRYAQAPADPAAGYQTFCGT